MSFLIYVISLLSISAVRMSYSSPVNSTTSTTTTTLTTTAITKPIISATSALSRQESSQRTEITLKQAIAIIEKRRLTDCVARSICELSCNPESFGPKGKAVYQTLKHFESDNLPKLAFYKEAAHRGRSIDIKNCRQCHTLYSKCRTHPEKLIRLASALTIKP